MAGRASSIGTAGPVLHRRDLNRALLARQGLLAREGGEALATVRRLVGLQAQSPDPPYYGLWSRLEGFEPGDLADLMTSRQVVRLALMRSTIHTVTAQDALALRPLLQPVLDRSLQGSFGALLAGVDRDLLVARSRSLVEESPLTFGELGTALQPDFPGRDAQALGIAARCWTSLVQVPPRGVWGRAGKAVHTTAEKWLGSHAVEAARSLDPAEVLRDAVLRYLAAFGPASVADVQKWCGLTRLGAVVGELGDTLTTFVDERGVTLYDLPDAPRPDASTPAPARLLAEYDNVLLSHVDRTRILGDVEPGVVMSRNGIVLGAVLLDGFVVGRWRVVRGDGSATATLTTLRRVRPADRAELTAEAERLLAFAAPDRGRHDVRFEVSRASVGA